MSNMERPVRSMTLSSTTTSVALTIATPMRPAHENRFRRTTTCWAGAHDTSPCTETKSPSTPDAVESSITTPTVPLTCHAACSSVRWPP